MAEQDEDIQPESAPAAAPAKAKKARRQLPESTKRLLLIIAGVFVLVGSVAGFYFTSDAFDDRTPVLVAARYIDAGETVSVADFRSHRVLIGAIPHIAWTPDAASIFDGMVALEPIEMGALVDFDMFIGAETAPVGVQLEVIVPLDVSLVTDEVIDGDPVLLVDPGAEPVEGDDGRPRRVVREFELTNFDGAQMRLFVSPEEWAEWTALLEGLGGTVMVKDLGVGAEAQETTQRLNAVWADQWSAAVEEVAAAVAAANTEPTAGPGELEVIVAFDVSLVPTSISDGDLVLLVDPGQEPEGGDGGRPRSVLQTLRLENYADGQMRMFVPPDEWARWRSIPDQLGADPQMLPVPEGTDIDEMTERLNAVWEAAWRNAAAEAARS